MAMFLVNADFKINVLAEVEAKNERDAREAARGAILNKDCEFCDPVSEPDINWVEFQCDVCDDTEQHTHCPECGDKVHCAAECDMLG